MNLLIFIAAKEGDELGLHAYGGLLSYGGNEKELTNVIRMSTKRQALLAALKECLDALKRPCAATIHVEDEELLADIKHCIEKKSCPKDDDKSTRLWQSILGHSFRSDLTTANFIKDSREYDFLNQVVNRTLNIENERNNTEAFQLHVGSYHDEETGIVAATSLLKGGPKTVRMTATKQNIPRGEMELRAIVEALQGFEEVVKVKIHSRSEKLTASIFEKIKEGMVGSIKSGDETWDAFVKLIPNLRIETSDDHDTSEIIDAEKISHAAVQTTRFVMGQDSKLDKNALEALQTSTD